MAGSSPRSEGLGKALASSTGPGRSPWIWVQLWEADGDSLATAHVYDHAGDFLFEAQWPLEVSLREGAIRGDAAVGVGMRAFDIPEIVRMTFRESG